MKIRTIFLLLIALMLVGYDLGQRVQASEFQPGSPEDPIITVGYVKNYLAQAFKPVSDKLAATNTDIQKTNTKIALIQDALNPKITLTLYKKTAKIGSKAYTLDVAPTLYKQKTVVPLRFIGEALKAQVIWDAKTRSITYQKGNLKIKLRVNDTKATIGTKTVRMDVPPIMSGSRVLVPLRFVAENLNAQVDYISKTKTIIIKGK